MKPIEFSSIKFKILQKLKKEIIISGEEIAKSVKISRSAVWKWIKILRKDGYIIKGSPKKGYFFAGGKERLLPEEIHKPKMKKFFKNIYFLKKVSSTMDLAKKLAEEGKSEGTIVIAEIQTSGRGRLGREWISPSGGIYFSIILRPKISPIDAPKINLMASVAVAESIKKLYNLNVKTKWPNDVLINDKKVSGILIELACEVDRIKWVILGIGINANTDRRFIKKIENATSLKLELKRKVSIVELMNVVLEKLKREYTDLKHRRFKRILSKWKKLSSTLKKDVKIITPEGVILGKAVDVSPRGALLLKLKTGIIKEIYTGDCIHLRKTN
ncbi:MAG: biotin--[acetyl-CoA-carboxylase] ligase [Endomicrobiia bacterium]